MKNLNDIIIELESKLLEEKTRNDSNELKKIISKDFIEYGSSGKIYNYDDTVNFLSTKSNEYKMIEIKTQQLSDDVVLSTFVAEKNSIKTLRSSIWKNENGTWKIIFHQGTVAK